MLTSILVNLILATLIIQPHAVGNIGSAPTNPEPITLTSGQMIAGASGIAGPKRVNYYNIFKLMVTKI